MPESLEELLRRRELLRERLEALDREIADLQGAESDAPPFLGESFHDPNAAEAILQKYRTEGVQSAGQAKRGCLLLFIAGICLLFVGLTAMYFYMRGLRGR